VLVSRLADVRQLYAMLDALRERVGEPRRLCDSHGRQGWPRRGVYFFFEPDELRSTSGTGPRVVRVGTHALTANSKTTLWRRVAQHRGVARSGGGNHRGSVFRLLVGEALLRRDALEARSWGIGSSRSAASSSLSIAAEEVAAYEAPIEARVTAVICAMTFLWLGVDDAPGPTSARGTIERNAIAMLSNWHGDVADPASPTWLGRHSAHERVVRSGLWNNDHVDGQYDPAFFDVLSRAIGETKPLD
jgi:hypothetical protein